MSTPAFTKRRAALGAGMLAAALLANPLGAPHTHAAFACRSDPIVVLSSGIVLDLSATIGTDVSNVASISYTLHAPSGSSIAKVVSTDGDVNYKEQFRLLTDSAAGVYAADTQVTTVPMTAGATLPAVTATIEGGYASTLGVTPGEVGLEAWTTSASTSTKKAPPRPKGTKAPATLPDQMNNWLNNWVANAPWSATASATGQAGQTVTALVNL